MPGKLYPSISRNSLSLYAAYAARKASVFLLAVAAARRLGAAEFGLYCLALVLVDFAARLTIFGTDILIVRDVASGRAGLSKSLGSVFGFRLVAGPAACCLLVAGSGIIGGSPLFPGVILIMGFGLLPHIIADLYLAVAQGRERLDLFAAVQAAGSIFGLVLALAALSAGWGLIGLAAAYTLRHLLELALALVAWRRLNLNFKINFSLRRIAGILAEAAPIGISRFLTIVYLGSGLIILQYFRGPEITGYFAGAMKIFEACGLAGMLTMAAAFPAISRLRASRPESLRGTVRSLARLFCWAGIPGGVLVALNAGRILGFVFGEGFSLYGSALAFLMLALPFSLNSGLFERLAYAAHDQKRVLVIRASATGLNLALILILLPQAGILAPAIAVLATEILMFVLLAAGSERYVPRSGYWGIVLRPAWIAAVSAAPLLFMGDLFYGIRSAVFVLLFLGLGKTLFGGSPCRMPAPNA